MIGEIIGGWLAKLFIPILLIAAISGWVKFWIADNRCAALQVDIIATQEENKRLKQWIDTYAGASSNSAAQMKILQEQIKRLRDYEKNKPKPPSEETDSDVDQSYLDSLFNSGVRNNKTPPDDSTRSDSKN